MSNQDYASKDLKRRPRKSFLVLISLVTVITTTTFLFLFSNTLLDVSQLYTTSGPMVSLRVFYESFIWAILLLSIILGVVVVSSTISLEMASRRRDIALMKSIGTTIDRLYDHFIAQAIVLLLGGIILGISFGTILHMVGLLWLSSILTGVTLTFVFPWIQIFIISSIFLITGYFAAQKPIYDTVNESPVKALNPDVGMKIQRSGFFDSFGLSVRMATRATGRRIHGSRRTMLSIFLSVALASILLIGGGIVETTSNTYLSRAMGTNVVAIGNPDLIDQYYSAYSLSGANLNDSFDFLHPDDIIPSSLVNDIVTMSSVSNYEERIVDYTLVEELPGIIWIEDPTNPEKGYYTSIGSHRTTSTLIIGADIRNGISDWYYDGSPLKSDLDAWIGGSLATEIFDDPLIQKVQVYGVSLNVSRIAFDVLNSGNIAITSYATLKERLGLSGPNLLLVQLDEYTQFNIQQIRNIVNASGLDLQVFEQQDLLIANQATISSLWALLLPLPVMALISAFLGLMNYLLVSVFGRFNDYVIMRSIGAKPLFIAKSMISEGVDLGLRAGIPAIIVGTIFSAFLLVPEAAVPSVLFLPITIGAMILAMLLVVVLAATPVYLLFSSKSDLRISEFQI
jgi:ABC-type antimicrobial peptide transport system permease subunit